MRWNELISVTSKLHNFNRSDKDNEKKTYNDRCKMLNSNPVLVARHFKYGVVIAPNLSENNVKKYISFVDKIAHAYLTTNKNESTEFFELVKLHRL